MIRIGVEAAMWFDSQQKYKANYSHIRLSRYAKDPYSLPNKAYVTATSRSYASRARRFIRENAELMTAYSS